MGVIEETAGKIQPLDTHATGQAQARLDNLTMPHWALGRLMDLAKDLAGMTGTIRPSADRRVVVVFAGDHGVTRSGVSLYPPEVTPQMVRNFTAGGAGVNALAKVSRADVKVVDMGVAGDLSDLVEQGRIVSRSMRPGTSNLAEGPAMTREEAVACVEAGIEIALGLAEDYDIFGTGDMGIGNTTPSSAITSVLTGKPVADVTGRGTGVDDTQYRNKVALIEQAVRLNAPDPEDAIDVLAKVGGFEIGGIAGLILGAAAMRKPVLIDGLISTAGALIAAGLAPDARHYLIAAHRSVEPGHTIALNHLGKRPFLDLEMRLGEGTGAALAMAVVEGAVRVLTEVATFEEAAVSGPA